MRKTGPDAHTFQRGATTRAAEQRKAQGRHEVAAARKPQRLRPVAAAPEEPRGRSHEYVARGCLLLLALAGALFLLDAALGLFVDPPAAASAATLSPPP